MIDHPPRARAIRIAVVFGVTLVTLANSVALVHWIRSTPDDPYGLLLRDHTNRIGALQQRLDTALRQPAAVKQIEFDGARQTLEARLNAIEQAHGGVAQAADVQVLQLRIERLEARLTEAQQAPPRVPSVRRPIVKAEAPVTPELPFHVVGLQERAGERFLSILPRGATTLAQIHLMREGSREDAWHLQSIEADAAVFRLGDHIQRVPVR